MANRLRNLEQLRLDDFLTREPDPGLVETVYGWALGEPLDVVLDEEMTGGDFVRSMRMVVDICRQVASVADGELREAARDAVYAIDRGVVRGASDLVATADEEE
jgi:ATP-dependent RNA helicase HelY